MNTINQGNKDKLVFNIIMTISVVIFIAVIILNRKILPAPAVLPSWTYLLPKLNAFINGTCSLLLVLSLYFIKKKNIAAHKTINLTAFGLSSLFLISYVVFHWIAPQTHYPENAANASVYFFILTTHIVLAAVVLPLVLLSFYRGLLLQVELHKKIVRYTYPIWLYVTITGVIVYLMISPYYPA
jgi:putative membrane protein